LAADFGYVMCDDEFVAPPVQGVVTA